MTRRTNARSAGCTCLLYIALGVTALVLLNGATGAQEIGYARALYKGRVMVRLTDYIISAVAESDKYNYVIFRNNYYV